LPSKKDQIESACRLLIENDPVLGKLIKAVGAFGLKPDRDRFGMLVRSIISQQISVAAARTIRARLIDLAAPAKLTPEIISAFPLDELRSVGLSQQKARYMHDLASKTADGTIRLNTIGRKSDDAIIAELTQVKGIGRWTAQMFLMFSLGRLNVMPHDDLGIRTALRNAYGLSELPNKATCLEIAEPWRPFATIGSWYCWRSLELPLARTGD